MDNLDKYALCGHRCQLGSAVPTINRYAAIVMGIISQLRGVITVIAYLNCTSKNLGLEISSANATFWCQTERIRGDGTWGEKPGSKLAKIDEHWSLKKKIWTICT